MTEERCKLVIHDGGVYGEETLTCDLEKHPSHPHEHHDDLRRMWWDDRTRVRIPMSRVRELRLIRAREE